MAQTINYRRPKLYQKQTDFVDCPSRYTIVEASTKVGKTVCCLIWIIEQAMQGNAGNNYWWIAPIYSQAGIAYGRLKLWLTQSLPLDYWKACEGEQAIELGNGTKIWFKGSDNPDSLYGEDVYAAVMDEASRIKEFAFHAVRSTLTATNGKIKIIGNVRGRKNWAYKLARMAQSGHANMSYFKLTVLDAVAGGVLPMSEVEDAKAILPDHVFKELYLAEPADDGGNPFGLRAIENCSVSELSDDDPVCFGVDLAKSVDFTVVVGLDADGMACRLERWQSDWDQTKKRIARIVGDVPTVVDSTGNGDPIFEDLHRISHLIVGFKFSSTSKQQLMEGLASAIQQSQVAFPRTVHQEYGWLCGELESFEYEYKHPAAGTRGGVLYSAPPGLHDDGVCALALAWHAFNDTVRNRFTLAKSFPFVTASN